MTPIKFVARKFKKYHKKQGFITAYGPLGKQRAQAELEPLAAGRAIRGGSDDGLAILDRSRRHFH
jgi:hypothetical protein